MGACQKTIFDLSPRSEAIMVTTHNSTVAISVFGLATKLEGKTALIVRTGLLIIAIVLLYNQFKKPNLTISVG